MLFKIRVFFSGYCKQLEGNEGRKSRRERQLEGGEGGAPLVPLPRRQLSPATPICHISGQSVTSLYLPSSLPSRPLHARPSLSSTVHAVFLNVASDGPSADRGKPQHVPPAAQQNWVQSQE